MSSADQVAAAPALLETKFHAPRRRRGVIARPRLDSRLQGEALPPLTLVSAPAGFGKTTLLAEWVAAASTESLATGWLSLDSRDNDPARFWRYVVAALRTAAPDVGAGALSLLQSSQSSRSSQSFIEAVLATLLNDLDAISSEVALVLDDYHVIETLDLHEAVAFFVEHLPPQVHLILGSRADPPLPLARLRTRGDLLEIRAADLRFTAEEATTYLTEAMGLELTTTDIVALERRTEGWIAALQLAALSMQGREDVADFIASFAGDDRFIVDYLVDEVLQRQSEDVRNFLLRTSLLSRFTGSLCAAVTDEGGAKAMLEMVDRANLFLVPLDDRRLWYRYHHLFADMLRARLLDEHPELVPELHRRASDWYADNGDRPEAIRHAMAAADFPRAAELIELAVPMIRQTRQETTLRNWLEALPRELFEARPVLSMGMVGAHMATGDVAGVEPLLDSVERWLETPFEGDDDTDPGSTGMVVVDHDEFLRLPAQVAVYRAGLALMAGDIHGTIAHANRALDLIATDDEVSRGAAAALVGLAHWGIGDLEAARRSYSDAVASFLKARFLPDALGCSLALADIQIAQGRLDDAMRTFESGLSLASGHGSVRGTADMHVGVGELLRERNELDAALRHLHASQRLGEHSGLPQNAYRWRVTMARVRQAQGDLAGALELLEQAEGVYNADFSPEVQPVAAVKARVQLAGGDVDSALRWASDRGLAADDELSYVHEFEHLTLARVLLVLGTVDRTRHGLQAVISLLGRLLEAAEDGQREGSAIEILILQALAHQARNDTRAALTALEPALRRAQFRNHVRVFLDEGAPMATLLRTAAQHGVGAGYARRLLAALDTGARRTAEGRLFNDLSIRELEVLRLLRSDLSGPDIARELMVSLNTVRTHTKNIYTKLGVNNRREAVRRAADLDL